MIRRWPIRVRLAAAFTAMMALVLLAVAWVTLHQSREALDESTNKVVSLEFFRDSDPVSKERFLAGARRLASVEGLRARLEIRCPQAAASS